ncbi:glycoside hydrolase family 16 protein [Cnuella takakiae]|nr:glycoside hydrolase family 16 protein [Cnuella takakiae]OLY94691.1 hypothetical protein BUE76_06355 [Cnuella takakiae]
MMLKSMGWAGLSIALTGTFFLSGCAATQNTARTASEAATIFFDDFSGASLDRSKWNVVVTGGVVNNEQQAYVDSSLTLYIAKGKEAEGAQNGALVLHPRFAPGFVTREGKKFDFISGRINSRGKVDFTYGTASARIKMTAGTGLWPAWWMLGNGRWPDAGEIDIMEYVGETDWTNAAVHGPGYSGETPFVNKFFFTGKTDVTQWHVYSVDWTPDSMLFKVDGVLFYRLTKPMVAHYGKWVFDKPQYLILNFALGGIYPVKVNGIKEPYYGIPAETVNLIKDGKCKMLVDWVRVSGAQ